MANKYLHLFETDQQFQTAYNGASYEEPWVSLTTATGKINYNKIFFLDLSNYQYPELGQTVALSLSEAQSVVDHIKEKQLGVGDKIKVLEPDENLYAYEIRLSDINESESSFVIGAIRKDGDIYKPFYFDSEESVYEWGLNDFDPFSPPDSPDLPHQPIVEDPGDVPVL